MPRSLLLLLFFCILATPLSAQSKSGSKGAFKSLKNGKKSQRKEKAEKRVSNKKAALKYLKKKKISKADYDLKLIEHLTMGDCATATALVLAGATVNRPGILDNPLHLAAKYGDPAMLQLLFDNEADPAIRVNRTTSEHYLSGKGFTVQHFAIENDHVENLKFLHDKGADLNAQTSDTHSPRSVIAHACYFQAINCVRYLHEQGVNIQQKDAAQASLMHIAARTGNLELVKYLHSAGLDMNATNRAAFTPIMNAAMSGKDELVRYMADNGADLNRQDNHYQNSVMHFIKRYCKPETTSYLISKGARTDLRNRNGETPDEYAAKSGTGI